MQWGGYTGLAPANDPRGYYLGVLAREIALAEEEDIREHAELYEALDHWRALSPSGVRKFEKGLQTGDVQTLIFAKEMIARFM